MGNMEEMQQAMKEKLSGVALEESLDGIVVKANGNKEITHLAIDESFLDPERKEELEDMLIVAINNIVDKASIEEAKASQEMINEMLPPGMSGLFG